MSDVRKEITDKIVDFVKGKANGTELREHLIVATHTGSGKTTNTLLGLDKIGAKVIYIAPFHDVIEENIENAQTRIYNYLHLKGKGELCIVPEYKHLANIGLDIDSFCDECDFKKSGVCPYENDIRRAETEHPNLAITHAHMTSWLQSFLNKGHGAFYHVVVIDENPINVFIQTKSYTRRELAHIYQTMQLLDVKTSGFDDLLTFLEILMKRRINYTQVRAFSFKNIIRNKYKIMKEYTRKLGELYMQRIIGNIPDDIISHLIGLMENFNANKAEHMIYYRNNVLTLSYFNSGILDLGLPIIALDGTANRDVWKSMLNTDNFEIFKRDYLYYNVYQGIRGRYVISSWTRHGKAIPDKLSAVIRGIADNKKRGVLVIGTKSIIRRIRERLNDVKNLEYAYYYFLRSKNQFYLTCDTIILACEPNPPQEVIDSYVELSGWPESVWRHIFREEEMLQAIGRIRQNIKVLNNGIVRENIEIYIMPNTGYDHTTGRSNLLPDGSDVTPVSISQMVDVAATGGAITDQLKLLMLCKDTGHVYNKQVRDRLRCSWSRANKLLIQMTNNKLLKKESVGYTITEKGLGQLFKRISEEEE